MSNDRAPHGPDGGRDLEQGRAELAESILMTAMSALTASVAHEVNQPLAGIVTNAGTCLRLLDATSPNLEAARETARRTIRDANRAAEVIARMRALFTPREFTPEPVDLNEQARAVIALSSGALERHRVMLQPELAADLPAVNGDRLLLQQVILHLLHNAWDAMSEVHDRPRHLVVRTEADGDGRVRVTVRDSGIGLSPDDMGSLFDSVRTMKAIGLFVSRRIVDRHQGRLWAEPNDGPGATFSFSLPRGGEP